MAFPKILKIIKYPQQRMDNINIRIRLSLKSNLNHFSQNLINISRLLKKDRLKKRVESKSDNLESKFHLLFSSFDFFLTGLTSRLSLSSGILTALSHENVLKRGFAIVKDDSLTLVRSSKALKDNQNLRIQFSEGDAIDVSVDKNES